jgi:8-oxo-dGTP diphosphatase
MAKLNTIAVVVGVIQKQGKILVALRPQHVPQPNLWEFPGGKVELGESSFEALVRELKEEVGITVQAAQPWLQLKHTYPERIIALDVWKVEQFTGEAYGREGQQVQWVTPQQLSLIGYPSANKPIIDALLA